MCMGNTGGSTPKESTMPATATATFHDAARDCSGLLTLVHRSLAEMVAEHRQDPNWLEAGDLMLLRERLIMALLPTRNCESELEARQQISEALAEVRPARA